VTEPGTSAQTLFSRRRFLSAGATLSVAAVAGCRGLAVGHARRLFFTSDGLTAVVDADGSGLRYLDFSVPGQSTWQPGPFFSDGRGVVFLSMEPRRDGPGRPFEEYYTRTPTHLWRHDLDTGGLVEIAHRERLAVFYTPALLLSDDRILVQVVRDKVGQLFSMNLDGTGAREFTRAGEGLPYGLSLSPDGRRVAFHLASPRGYEIWTCDVEGGARVRVAGDPDHLCFGTSWSPDGKWILYQDCLFKSDPGHDWSDLCIGRPDGSGHRVLTRGQGQWFAATYGGPDRHGGGSNMPMWTRDGGILFSRRSPGAKVPWEFQPGRPDTDHFNRDFRPDLARGGTEICRLDPVSGETTVLVPLEEGVWNCRACASPDGRQIAFCRAATGEMTSLWVADSDGRNARLLSRGFEGRGADHPRWLP
jgi:TolB protein